MRLSEATAEVFSSAGVLAQADRGFRLRPGQTEMGLAVARTLETGGMLVAEAGTGVGKTFAYLIPVLLSGERALISTATKALQDQIFSRDLPFLRGLLGVSLQAALLKGRSSYLCPYRLELAEAELDAGRQSEVRWVARVRRWAGTTQTGDMSEMPGFTERSVHLPLVTSTRENCLGSECPSFRQCYVNKARREALAADLVVINHHLFFAGHQVRESGMAELLPSVRAVIIDEAHQFNETGVQFLGERWSSSQLLDFVREVQRTGLKLARGLADWAVLTAAVAQACTDWMRCLERPGQERIPWEDGAPQGVDATLWQQLLAEQSKTLHALHNALVQVRDMAPELGRLCERCSDQQARARLFAGHPASGRVRWIEPGGTVVRLIESPLDIAADMRRHWGAPSGAGGEVAGQEGGADTPSGVAAGASAEAGKEGQDSEDAPRAWIFTSATLGTDARLSHFTKVCGLEDATVLQVASPFDFARQSMLYVPAGFPEPRETLAHGLAVAALAAEGAAGLHGRTLVLTTTLKALQLIGQELRSTLALHEDIEVLVQGEHSKQVLMERFRAPQPGTGHVLVASTSFWEGFDVPGDALQLVVIDKLPFPAVGDPLVQARARRLEQQGVSPFTGLFLPEAAIALKQGAGRLIRTETDKGILAVCDMRLVQKGYGRMLLSALPPMARMRSKAKFEEAIRRLAAAGPAGPAAEAVTA